MWNRSRVLDICDPQTRQRHRAESGFATGTGAAHVHAHATESEVISFTGCFLGCDLRGERGVLPGSPEALVTRTGPGDGIAHLVGQRDDGVVESGKDERFPGGNALLGRAGRLLSSQSYSRSCRLFPCRHPYFIALTDFLPAIATAGPLRVRALECVRCP